MINNSFNHVVVVVYLPSHVRLFATPWTVAHQAPLSMDFPDKTTGVGSHFLLQGIFLTQGLNWHLLHSRQILYHLSHQLEYQFNHGQKESEIIKVEAGDGLFILN